MDTSRILTTAGTTLLLFGAGLFFIGVAYDVQLTPKIRRRSAEEGGRISADMAAAAMSREFTRQFVDAIRGGADVVGDSAGKSEVTEAEIVE